VLATLQVAPINGQHGNLLYSRHPAMNACQHRFWNAMRAIPAGSGVWIVVADHQHSRFVAEKSPHSFGAKVPHLGDFPNRVVALGEFFVRGPQFRRDATCEVPLPHQGLFLFQVHRNLEC
jgi:hypothetical protein